STRATIVDSSPLGARAPTARADAAGSALGAMIVGANGSPLETSVCSSLRAAFIWIVRPPRGIGVAASAGLRPSAAIAAAGLAIALLIGAGDGRLRSSAPGVAPPAGDAGACGGA